MAISVRLPQGRGPHVEHYLIEKMLKPASNKPASSLSIYRLEGSEHYFNSILQLVIHYSNCQDELPVQLGLPSVFLTASRSQLNSLALLGQEFWQSKFVSLKQLPKNSLNNETLAMVNQNCDELLRATNNNNASRHPPRRHNSNSSESNASKSSCSPMPNVICSSRRNTSDSTSPPPLPPKCDPTNSPLIGLKKSLIIDDINCHRSSSQHPQTTIIETNPKLPPRGMNCT